jgi:Ca2+-binding RTX toxin-like protein
MVHVSRRRSGPTYRVKGRPRRKARIMMRRTVLLLLATTTLALVAAGGIALAATFTCTTNPCDGTTDNDEITGTVGAETINARAGDDQVNGLDAADTLNGEEGNDRLNGGAGNDDLAGGLGNDQYFVTTNWGSDTILDSGGNNDSIAPDGGATAAMTNLTVNLVSSSGPEYSDGHGNTVDWNDGAIGSVSTGAGDDVISQRPKDSNGLNGGAGNDTYTGYTSDPFGGDSINDPSGAADVLDFSNYDLAQASWKIFKVRSTDNVEILQISFAPPGTFGCVEEFCHYVTLSKYFDNTSTDACASGPGPGLIETIKFADDPSVDFAKVKRLLGCAPKVISTSPANNTTGIATDNVYATFSKDMDPNTLTTSTFTLTKQGSSTPVDARVSYDRVSKLAILDPTSDLEATTTYKATIKGGSTGAEDLAGNALEQDYTWTFTTAAPPPPSCTITGTANAETISGTSGADVICAGGGNDTVKGLGGNDILKGQDGNDKLLGGVGDDTLDGGLGTDTASYSASLTAVNASLATNSSTGEGTDTFLDVENLLGSSKADTLTGSGANNTLTGGGGADTERGGAGNDKVVGSGGADFLYGEDGTDTVNSKDGVNGNDSLDGGSGPDTKVTDTTEKSIVGFP